MKKTSRMPHEEAIPEDGGIGPEHDGLPATDGLDVQGHSLGHTKGERLSPGMPGTGGDRIAMRADEDDVEGHSFGHTQGERLSPGMPGTGGD